MNNDIVLFDFEYTAWEGSQARKWSEPWEHREIIQIAAVRAAVDEGMREMGCFNCLVKPQRNPVLSPYITSLTGIEQSAVDTLGISFSEAFAAFYAFCERGCLPLFCYGDDVSVLAENFAIHDHEPVPFPAGIYDIRVIFEQVGINTRQYTSGTVSQAVGADFTQTAHNALNDVRSLAATIRQLTQMGKIGADWVEVTMAAGGFPITR